MKPVCLLWLLIAATLGHAKAPKERDFVAPNVAFSDVMKLPFRAADEKISYGDEALQFGWLWLGQANKPLVILIHGGCWLNAFGVDHAKPMASALSDAGYAVWALEYRRTGDEGGGWPGSFVDIQSALSSIHQLPDAVNRDQLILLGHSAGGHLALLAHQQNKLKQGIVQTIGLAAITDLPQYAQGQNSCQTAGPKFMGGMPEDLPEAYQAADPQQHGLYSNTLLLHGQADVIVPEKQAKLAGATTMKLSTAGHFDWIHPGSEAFALLLKQLQIVADSLK